MSLRSVATSSVLLIVVTIEATAATASSTTTASAVTSTFPLFLDLFEAIAVVIFVLILLLLLIRLEVTALSLAVSTALLMTGLLLLTLLTLLARRLSVVDLDLFGKLLLNFWQVLVGLSVVLVLSAEQALEGADKLRRSLGLWLRLLLLFVLLEALKFVLSARCSLGRGRKLSNRTTH
jgi:hypothetical protein